ncbi:MAG: peptidoglycan-binding protein [Oscillospiraceae bacterium]|jgi:hypothetical protein|nr:peptidoglycan-binding protein [Oscillospiraceae bacterium]
MIKKRCGIGTAFLLILVTITAIFLPFTTSNAAEVKVAIAEENVILRTKPDAKSEGQTTVKKGDIMTLLDGSTAEWAHVEYKKKTGYVSRDYVKYRYMDLTAASSSSSSSSSSSAKLPDKISELGDPPDPMKPGDSGKDVKKLQQALTIEGYFRGSCDGDYGDYTVAAVKDFQASRGLTQDGVAGAGTIKYLFGVSRTNTSSSSSKYKTEKPNWYSGGSSLVPKNATFTIKDVRTGVTFNVRRWSGANHMDCEPLTASDTAKMKKVFGGTWKWARRPILILYRGHVYAASMNGMPHEDNITPGNDFDGHFCVHFAGSKTHGSDKVDADHQAAVNEAARATW